MNLDLTGLKDIHLPEKPPFFPLAWGWWLLLPAIILARLFHIPVVPLAYWMILGCVLFSGYAVWNASRLPKVQRVEISSSLLPADWQPLKIVQLTDFHIGQGFHEQWLRQVVQKTNTLLPDVIVITGDSIDNTVEQLLPELLPLKDLKAEKGVYMVFGNHEYYYDSKAWQRAFEAMGIKVLKNNHVVLENSKDAFVLGGGDWGASLKAGQADAHVEQTFTGSDEQLPRILLSHYPLAWKASLKHNVLLQLSGHTHGGMSFPVNFLTSLFNGGYLRGLYEKDGRFLYVSDGTGLWGGFPARAGTQNEIVEIILKRKEGA